MAAFSPISRPSRRARLLALAFLTSLGGAAVAQPTTTYSQLPTTATIAIPASPAAYPTTGTVRYVDPVNGSDTSSGQSWAGAWKTFEHALATAPAGSRVIFKGGTYRVTTKVNLAKSLTLQPEAGATVWIKGSQVVTGWAQVGTSQNWRVTWNQKFPTTAGDPRLADPNNLIAGCLDMVFLNNKPLKQVGRVINTTHGSATYFHASNKTAAGVLLPVGPGEFSLDYATGQLTLGESPVGKTVEVTALRTGLEIKKHTGSNVLIQGLGFAHFADQAVASGAADTRLEYNAFAWNGLQGAAIYGVYDYMNNGTRVIEPAGINNTLRGNDFVCNGMVGVSGGQVNGLMFASNTVRFNNCERFATGWSSGGAKFTQSTTQTIRGNAFTENWGYALWLDIGAKDPIVVNNTLRKNYGGIFFEISDGAIIAGNVAVDNGNGVFVANSSGARIYNNTLINNSKNIIVKESTRKPETHELGKGALFLTNHTVVKNNIFFNNTGASTDTNLEAVPAKNAYANSNGVPAKAAFGSTAMFASPTGFNYNAYYSPSASLIRWTPNGNYNADGKTTTTIHHYTTLPSFRTAVPGMETQGLHLTGATDPFFVNLAGGDYRLRCTSAAFGAGTTIPNEITTAMNWPTGTVQVGAWRNTSCAPAIALTTVVVTAAPVAQVQLYPNPAQATVAVTFERTTAQPISITLLDQLGRAVAHQAVQSHAGVNHTDLRLPTLPSGLYLLNLTSPDGYSNTQRLHIKQ